MADQTDRPGVIFPPPLLMLLALVAALRQTWEQDYHAGHGGGFLGS